MEARYVNEDLKREREAYSSSSDSLSIAIYGKEVFPKLVRLHSIFAKNELLSLQHIWACDASDRYLKACRMAEELARLIREHKLIDDEAFVGALQVMVGEDMFLLLHLTMFICTLEAMCNEEQAKNWLPLAKDFRILGTYAQTELGHGSNVSRLETEAVFDEKTDEWVLNTPSLTARKWWVGGLAKSCTHCILMARLRIGQKDYGVHPFMLQVRDLNNHKSMPGVSLTHIGQKMGYQGMDNGSLHLTNVRIPRKHLLMRFSEVARDGTYTRTGSRKLLYSTLTFTRKQIILSAGANLSRSVVIAIRYAAVRRQFASTAELGALEQQVLSYSTTQRTLMPLLGMAVAFIQAGVWTDGIYQAFKQDIAKGDFKYLEELHLVTSSLKSFMTLATADGMEKCRKACGGHGYMLASGVALHFINFVPQATYEGDFVVLSIQAGRLLLKVVGNKMAGNVPEGALSSSVRHLYTFDPAAKKEAADATLGDFGCPQWLVKAFEIRATAMVYLTAQRFSSLGGPSSVSAFEAVKVDFTKITIAHAQLLVLRAFLSHLQLLEEEHQIEEHAILKCLFCCLALSWMDEHQAEFLLADAFSIQSYSVLAEALAAACLAARRTAVAVADAFKHTDNFLNSALGRYDGDVYNALLESTTLESLNNQDVPVAYERHLQYILHPERKVPRPKL